MILLDIKLPRVDGLEVLLQQMKAVPDPKATPVVTPTSPREERDLLRSYNLGTNADLVEPITLRFITETVKGVWHFWEDIDQLPSTAELEL